MDKKKIPSDEMPSFFNISNDITCLYSMMRNCRDDIESCMNVGRRSSTVIDKLTELIEKVDDINQKLTTSSAAGWISLSMRGTRYKINDENGNPIQYTYEDFDKAVGKQKQRLSSVISSISTKLKTICVPTREEYSEYVAKTQQDFNSIVPLFRETQQINQHLKAILVYAHPAKMNQVGEDQLPSFELTDEGYIKQIELLKSEANPFTRMTILQVMIKTLIEGIHSMESKAEKLSKLMNGPGVSSGERSVAIKKRQLINDSINILNKRLNECTDLMCELRNHIIETVVKFSKSTFKLYQEGDPILATSVLKHDIKSAATDLIVMDDRIKMDNFKRDKKGRNIIWNNKH